MSVPASVPKRSGKHLLRRFGQSGIRNWESYSSNSTTSPFLAPGVGRPPARPACGLCLFPSFIGGRTSCCDLGSMIYRITCLSQVVTRTTVGTYPVGCPTKWGLVGKGLGKGSGEGRKRLERAGNRGCSLPSGKLLFLLLLRSFVGQPSRAVHYRPCTETRDLCD